MQLIDSHCHLDFPDFDQDRADVIQQAEKLGVQRFVLAAVSREHWPRLWHTAQSFASCYASIGLHPYFLAQHQPDDICAMRLWLEKNCDWPKLCAIGEIGLDYQITELDRAEQQFYFEQQLQLAKEFSLPVIVHARKSHAQVIATLKQIKPERGGIIHAFNASLEQAKEYQKLGFLLGIGGAYSWHHARKLRAMLPKLPLQQLVLETDSPDMPPSFQAGQRNSPQNLPRLCQLLADELLHIPAPQLASQTTNNLFRLFNW